jgi:membrane-bound lytic murein transglycosylase D
VRSGETLGEIAARYGTDLYLLKKINSIAADRRLRAGDRILVPIPEHGPASEEEMLFDAKKDFKTQEIGYTVKRGDTVWSIARKYNTDVERILTANGLSFDSVIKPGDEITLWLDISLMP